MTVSLLPRKLKVSFFGGNIPSVLSGLVPWEITRANLRSQPTGEKTGDFPPLLIQLKMDIEKGRL
jgi:hypothetical protein